jgi:hypothetical protein
MKPMTYMNNSGQAVKEVVESLGLPLSGTLVVHDDIALPLGTLRVRSKGSDGGHNGVYSIIYHLNSNGFPPHPVWHQAGGGATEARDGGIRPLPLRQGGETAGDSNDRTRRRCGFGVRGIGHCPNNEHV